MMSVQKPRKGSSSVIISPDTEDQKLNDVNPQLVEDLYKKYGAILFRGFDFSVDNFRELTTTYCSHSVKNFSAGRETIDDINNIQTVDPGDNPFPLHPEMSREPWKPDVCFFACETAPKEDGQTFFCDGIELVRKLPTRVLKAFNRRKLHYSLVAPPEFLKYWLKTENYTDEDLNNPPEDCPFKFTKYAGKIFRTYEAPVLHKPMFSNKLAFGNFLLFARYIHNDKWFPVYEDGTIVPDDLVEVVRKTGEKLTEYKQWQEGDVMMVDNTRFLHGRTRIHNLKERRILSYFGYLRFACTKQDPVPNAPWRNPCWRDDVKT